MGFFKVEVLKEFGNLATPTELSDYFPLFATEDFWPGLKYTPVDYRFINVSSHRADCVFHLGGIAKARIT